jgi:LuxR family maltose regulon positive regulatory protein
MTTPILSTKPHVPLPPRALIHRPRLTEQLDRGAQGKFILVFAPAGYGKSTLIAEWANQGMDTSVLAWLHLDESDNDLFHFLTYLIASLQLHKKDIGEIALAGLLSVPPVPTEAALASLLNELDSAEKQIILVIDDYHLIDSPPSMKL